MNPPQPIDLRNCTSTQLAAQLKQALETTGFVYLTNHPLATRAQELFDTSAQFFRCETEAEKVFSANYDRIEIDNIVLQTR